MWKVLTTVFLLVAYTGKSQKLEDFVYLKDKAGGNSYVGVSVDHAFLLNANMPDTSVWRASGYLLDVNLKKYNFEKWGVNYQWDYKLLFDLVFLTKQMVDRKSNGGRTYGSTVSGGIAGWHQWTWNAIARQRLNVGVGIALNDYFVGTTYFDKKEQKARTPEPQGWYLSGGTALSFSYLLNSSFVLHGKCSYVAAFSRPVSITYAEENNDYPMPHFVGASAILLSKWGLFAEFQFCGLINRGAIPGNPSRTDLKLGFNFVL
jgi:hypothetical protein